MKDIIEMAMALRDDFNDFKERFNRLRISERLAEEWIDGQKVMDLLKISKRTLQNLRDHGDLAYSSVKGKFYYKTRDLEELLQSNYLKKRKKVAGYELHELGTNLHETGPANSEQ